MTTVAETLSSANDLLAQHNALLHQVRSSQRNHKRNLRALSNPPNGSYELLLKLPVISSPQHSPTPSPTSPIAKETFNQAYVPDNKPRRDLPPAKRARVSRYSNYVPEEETIRNDYSQRYVDGGEWPQDWVLGAEPERRFEEFVCSSCLAILLSFSIRICSQLLTFMHLSICLCPGDDRSLCIQ